MADEVIKISELDDAGTLAGDEILVLVQSGITVKALLSVIATFLGISGGGREITNVTKQTALQLNSNWGTAEDYTPVMQSNTSTVLTGQSEHDYFYGTDSVTASIYKYEIIKIATVLSVIRIPLKY